MRSRSGRYQGHLRSSVATAGQATLVGSHSRRAELEEAGAFFEEYSGLEEDECRDHNSREELIVKRHRGRMADWRK